MEVISGDIVARAQRGERVAQRELYDRYADAVFGYVVNSLCSREEAVELAQRVDIEPVWVTAGTQSELASLSWVWGLGRKFTYGVDRMNENIKQKLTGPCDAILIGGLQGSLFTDEVVELYEKGELHWTGNSGLLPSGRLTELSKREDARSSAELGTAWLWLNVTEGPTSDKRVRQALSLAIDRSAIAAVLGPSDVVSARLVPPGMPGYSSPEPASSDLDKARALLADAGYPGGEGFPALELAVDARPVHQRIAEVVAARWTEALGLEVTPYVRQYGAHADAMRSGQFQVARGGWLGDYPDPSSFLELLGGDNSLNDSGWSNTGYDALVQEAARTEDPASRLRLLAKAERLLLEEAPIIPLYHFGSLSLLKPYVAGFTDNPLQVHLLRYLSVSPSGPSMTAGG